MPHCIKCAKKFTNKELGIGACTYCGVDRGWKVGETDGGAKGLFCYGCNQGYTSLDCPSCGHKITGNDLGVTDEELSENFLSCTILIVFLWIVGYLIYAFLIGRGLIR
jgi:DNA-directed RNA polymerase subunit RPC12/RpoP